MENDEYQTLRNYPKITNKTHLVCAAQGTQTFFNGRATFVPEETFKVVQVRKGHRRKDELTYVLMHRTNNTMVRVDLIGARHQRIPTPHIHIFDEAHDQGQTAIPLSQIKNYDTTNSIEDSLGAFLKYNNFDINEINISQPLPLLGTP